MSLGNVFSIAGTGMTAQSIRLNTVASNLANAQSASSSSDTVYRGRHPVFAALQHNALSSDGFIHDAFNQSEFNQSGFNQESLNTGVSVLGIVESDAPLQPRYEPNHPMANEDGYVFYPNINVVEEMTDMISASRSFQMNVEVMDSAKQMIQRALSLGQ